MNYGKKLELQQETEKSSVDLSPWFFRGATAEELCLLTLLFTRGPGAFAAAIEEAHSSRSSGEKQRDSDYAVGKTKGVCEFTSFCMHLQGYFTKVKPADFTIVEISTAIENYSEITQQYQRAYTCIRGCTTGSPPGPCLYPSFSPEKLLTSVLPAVVAES